MHIDSMFPSKYLKASDLQGRNVLVVIDHLESTTMPDKNGADKQKWVLYFQHKEKGLVLNKVNSTNIAAAYGGDTDDWIGKEIVLFPAMVDSFGETVEAIRVRQPRAADRPKQNGQQIKPPPAPMPPQPKPGYDDQVSYNHDMSDEIPF